MLSSKSTKLKEHHTGSLFLAQHIACRTMHIMHSMLQHITCYTWHVTLCMLHLNTCIQVLVSNILLFVLLRELSLMIPFCLRRGYRILNRSCVFPCFCWIFLEVVTQVVSLSQRCSMRRKEFEDHVRHGKGLSDRLDPNDLSGVLILDSK